MDATVLFRCKQHAKDLTHPVGGNNNHNNNNNNGKINPIVFKVTEEKMVWERMLRKKLRDISIRAGQSGANYVDSVKNLEIEHQPSWDYLGRLDPKGEEQVKGGTRIASNLRWVEKNGMLKWKFDATVKRSVNDDQFVLVDPLDAPLYSYEIPSFDQIVGYC